MGVNIGRGQWVDQVEIGIVSPELRLEIGIVSPELRPELRELYVFPLTLLIMDVPGTSSVFRIVLMPSGKMR